MVESAEISEVGVLKYFLEEAKRRAENLAKSDNATLETFGEKVGKMIDRLINLTTRAERGLEQLEIRARADLAYEELGKEDRG